MNLRYIHLVAGASQSDTYRAAAKAAIVLTVLFLILTPVYLLADELISNRGYSALSRYGAPLWVPYFLFAAGFLVAWPKMMAVLRPFEGRTAFVLYALCLTANLGALLLVVAEAK